MVFGSGTTPVLMGWGPKEDHSVPSFMQWYATQDMRKQLVFVRQALKYLQWQFHDGDARPWLLKCPVYCGMEPLLADVFPGAVFVVIHREPVSRIASGAGLLTNYQLAYSEVDRAAECGPTNLAIWSFATEQQMKMRDAHPDLPMLDIGYADLTNAAERVVENIYIHAELPLSSGARQAMGDWERDNAQHKLGTIVMRWRASL